MADPPKNTSSEVATQTIELIGGDPALQNETYNQVANPNRRRQTEPTEPFNPHPDWLLIMSLPRLAPQMTAATRKRSPLDRKTAQLGCSGRCTKNRASTGNDPTPTLKSSHSQKRLQSMPPYCTHPSCEDENRAEGCPPRCSNGISETAVRPRDPTRFSRRRGPSAAERDGDALDRNTP